MTPLISNSRSRRVAIFILALIGLFAICRPVARAADHNDPIAINSIFDDVPINAADLYDLFGFPSPDRAGGEKVVVALTFAPVPDTGVFDPDMLYVLKFDPDARVVKPMRGEPSLDAFLDYAKQVNDRFVQLKASEVRVSVGKEGQATVNFVGFPTTGSFSRNVETNKVTTITTPDGFSIKAYIGGRDDAFFNDLPGFFRSINYAPQFYKVPMGAPMEMREIPTPKTLLELEGNRWFNADALRVRGEDGRTIDPGRPQDGKTLKLDLPKESLVWTGDRFFKDADGDYRFVYSGKDAQAGINVNAIILEIPMAFLTSNPEERVVNSWGESWIRKASAKIPTVPNEPPPRPFLLRFPWALPLLAAATGLAIALLGIRLARRPRVQDVSATTDSLRKRRWFPILLATAGILLLVTAVGVGFICSVIVRGQGLSLREAALTDLQMKDYKLIDTDGVPFSDAALSERLDKNQLGANNILQGRRFVIRTAHLGWGFGPSITALGLQSSFDHGNSPISVHKEPSTAIEAFPRVKKVLFQELRMPDESWNPTGKNIPLKRGVDIFVPNVCAIDMDTTGTWPFGRRLEDQVATRFLSIFLDMSASLPDGTKYNIETLGNQALWDGARIKPKTPPNPLKNDKEFLKEFPYLADPWPSGYTHSTTQAAATTRSYAPAH